jgi:hypothetical protein
VQKGRRPIVALAAVGLLAGLLLAEASVRIFHWKPPLQMVRGNNLHAVDGVPVWEQATDRHNRACVEQHPERLRVLFFGSSITFGVGLRAEEALTAALQEELNRARPAPGFCVLNFAQPGFAFEQKLVVARQEVARYRPALIMWEDWVEWRDYRMIGDTAYGIGDLKVRDDGYVGIRFVPDALNRFLFEHSRLYEYATLTLGEEIERVPGPPPLPIFVETRLVEVPRLAQSVGAELILYLAPPLDQPFAALSRTPPDWHTTIRDWARGQGIPVVALQDELIDQDYQALRLDPCCHLNAAGHRALVPVMTRLILDATQRLFTAETRRRRAQTFDV